MSQISSQVIETKNGPVLIQVQNDRTVFIEGAKEVRAFHPFSVVSGGTDLSFGSYHSQSRDKEHMLWVRSGISMHRDLEVELHHRAPGRALPCFSNPSPPCLRAGMFAKHIIPNPHAPSSNNNLVVRFDAERHLSRPVAFGTSEELRLAAGS